LRLRVADPLLGDAAHADKLRAALTQRFGRPVRLQVEVGATSNTAAAQASAQAQARQQAAEQAFAADPLVRTVMDRYGASVVPGSVRALDN
ncbi:MAG TPA: DNA polymerase III subunit gamma/tau, partial [Burkholderiaceae bacterium]|nr:DNA polymerase III subunit gamma/tau [Burkholderiaceae bacterium]